MAVGPGPKSECRICGNAAGNRDFRVREMMFSTREEFGYFQCASCGCLQIASIPSDMSPHYPAGYYSYSTAREERTVPAMLRSARRWKTRAALKGGWVWKGIGRPILGASPFVEQWLRPAGIRL